MARIMYNYVKWGDWLTSSDYAMQFYTDCGNNKHFLNIILYSQQIYVWDLQCQFHREEILLYLLCLLSDFKICISATFIRYLRNT